MGCSPMERSGRLIHWEREPSKIKKAEKVELRPSETIKADSDDFWKKDFEKKVIKTAKR